MKDIMIPVSPGELLDKLSILAIKCAEITDPEKLVNVERERALLQGVADAQVASSPDLSDLYHGLSSVNRKLWQIEDEIRACERTQAFGDAFIALARAVYVTNDRRAELKRRINLLSGSGIVEEKSYSSY